MAIRNLFFVALAVLALGGCSSELSGRDPNAIIRGVHYVGLSVADVDRSATFYKGTVNMQQVSEQLITNDQVIDKLLGRSGARVQTRLLKSANAQLRIMAFENPSTQARQSSPVDVYGPGIAHVCFQVNQDTQAYQKFLKAGGKVIGDRDMMQINPSNPVYYAYAHDLDDAIVEIEHVDVAQLDLPTPPKNDYRIRQVALSTPDMDRAVAFYSQLFQEQKPRRVGRWLPVAGDKIDAVSGQKDSKLKFTWFQVRNLEFEIIQFVSHPTSTDPQPRPLDASGYNMVVFDVSDLDAARELFLRAGGSLELENLSMDGEEIFFGRDPDGNLLGFQVLPDDSVLSSQNFPNNGIE